MGRLLCALVAALMLFSVVLATEPSRGASVGFSYAPVKPEAGETITVSETVSDPGLIEKIFITVYYEDSYGAVIYPLVLERDLIRDMEFSQLANGECTFSYSFTAGTVGKLKLNIGLSPQNTITSHTIDVYAVGAGHTAPIDGPDPPNDPVINTNTFIAIVAIIVIVAAVAALVIIRKRSPPSGKLKHSSRSQRRGGRR